MSFSIFDNFFGGDRLALERFLTNFWAGVLTQIADNLWDETLASGSTAILQCGNGVETFTAGFYRGSCVSFCVGMRPNGALDVNQVSCGSTCCVEKRNYCIDPVTGETVIEIVVEQVNEGECFDANLPACPEGSFFQSPCFELCETE